MKPVQQPDISLFGLLKLISDLTCPYDFYNNNNDKRFICEIIQITFHN